MLFQLKKPTGFGLLIILTIFFSFEGCISKNLQKVELTYKEIATYKDISPIKDSLVIPLIYTNTVSLKSLDIEKKKQVFVQMILPSILVVKHSIEQDAHLLKDLKGKKILNIQLQEDELSLLNYLYDKYGTKDINELEIRTKSHPTSIVLAQAAIESGWGTSEFFLKANNIFGIWASAETKFKMRANATRAGKPIYLRKYPDLSSSIEDYFFLLAKVKAYKKFRKKRAESDNPMDLLPLLNNYSELGKVYTGRVKRIIKENNFQKYDHYRIDPKYLSPISKNDILMASLKNK